VKSVSNQPQPQPPAAANATQLPVTAIEWSMAAVLCLASAVVVVWQNAHVAVLWDLSYTLEHSYRISLGDVPYRDFPFAHPPITFLIQAAIIKLTGRVFWHHVAYAAGAGAAATALTWRIMRRLLGETRRPRLLALLLAAPLVPLGIYSIFPHPFYDPDCALAVLVSLALLLCLDERPQSIVLPILAGSSLVIPLFVKQNIGLAFLLSSVCLIAALTIWQKLEHKPARHYVIAIIAALAALALSLLVIQRTAGLGNYWHWTIQFAAERRTPARGEMLGIYTDKMNLVWLGLILAEIVLVWVNRNWNRLLLILATILDKMSLGRLGLIVRGMVASWFSRNRNWPLLILATILFASPFVWPTLYLLRDSDPSERAERLINIWPVLLVVSFVSAIVAVRRRQGIARILPFIIIAAIHGCFMSQQLWGSTYGIWPLLMILVAIALVDLTGWLTQSAELVTVLFTSLLTVSLLIAGGFYGLSHERLSYANLEDGDLKRATLPQLKGLSTRGDWIPNFEELVRYSQTQIPADAGILLLPGEDAFYYATGRRPQFPVLLFDHTVNPYSPEQIRAICRERNITWVIVKQDLQNEEDAVDEEKDRITSALEDDFEQVESLTNYDIYRRVDPNAKKDSDDNDDDDNDDDK
jgi:hypothetical protein